MEVRNLIFDIAGTLVDPFSRAPVDAFRQVIFEIDPEKVPSYAEVRKCMGMDKESHFKAILPGHSGDYYSKLIEKFKSVTCSETTDLNFF